MKIKVAFGSVPKDGGTYTFYKNIRPYLTKHNVEIFCISVGKVQANLWEDSYADKNCVLLAKNTYNIKRQARIFTKWCIDNDINIVMGINSEAILSAIPHLPKQIIVLSRCANAFDHGYRITMSGKDRLEAIFAITPKLEKDLISSYGAPQELIHLIPNGINPKPFNKASETKRGANKKIRLGFLGRLEHNQKGVLHLPHIVKLLDQKSVNFELQIAGKGKHKEKLEEEMSSFILDGRVKLVGALNPSQVPAFFEKIDVYLFPSHFEGCPNALLEAIMSGCVPIAWLIEGITDFVIKNENTGFLNNLADYNGVVDNIIKLYNNRTLLKEMSINAATDARNRFTPDLTAKSYFEVFEKVLNSPIKKYQIKPWSKFKIEANFQQNSDKWIPRSLKMKIKEIIKSFR